jgi:hypothetical protein
MRDAGYLFAGRYVRRATPHSDDLSIGEVMTLLDAGLGVTVFQHVAAPGWMPSESLGRATERSRPKSRGSSASRPASSSGATSRACRPSLRRSRSIKFCNAWYDAVRRCNTTPGSMWAGTAESAATISTTGSSSGATLPRTISIDRYPAVRGVCMQQGSYPPPGQRGEGVPFGIPFDTTRSWFNATFNNLPAMLLPRDPG